MPQDTASAPLGLNATTSLLARVWPAAKLMLLATGMPVPAGKRVRKPAALGEVTVMLRASAFAPEGMPQRPVRAKVRTVPPPSAGPPSGPGAWRVSTRRHGGTVL